MATLQIERISDALLRFGLLLFGLPACVLIAWLTLSARSSPQLTKITSADVAYETLSGVEFNQSGFSRLSDIRPEWQALRWASTQLPNVEPLPSLASISPDIPMARVWLRIRYTIPKTAKARENLALYGTRIMGGAYSVWMNGELLRNNVADWRMQWNHPILLNLPARFRPGEQIELYVGVPYLVSQGYAIGTLHIGPESEARLAYERRVFWQLDLPWAGLLVALALGLLCLHFWWSRREEVALVLLFYTSIAWFICNLQYFVDFSDNVFAMQWFAWIVDASISWVFVLMYLFAFRFDQSRYPRTETTLLSYAIAITLVTMPVWHWETNGLLLQHYFNLLMMFSMAGFLCWRAYQRRSRELSMLTLAVSTPAVLGMHDLLLVSSQRQPDAIHIFPYSTFLIFGAFLYTLNRRHLRALQEVEDTNARQEECLRTQALELQEKHQQLLTLERRETLLSERQRLTQDIHDGIGASLMTSLVRARQGALNGTELVQVLSEAIDDLRLIINSIDVAAEDLSTLLAELRFRLGGRLEGVGIRVHWRLDELPELSWLDADHRLELMRFVQESIANIIKHAQANEVWLEVIALDDGIHLRIADNGCGFDPSDVREGRGMKNLRHRARRLNGTLQINSAPGTGTAIELWLPIAIEKHGPNALPT